MYKSVIENSVENGFNVRDEYKHASIEELKEIANEDRLPFRVCAVNVEGDLNIGMMARTSFLLGAEKFYIYGRRKIDRRSLVGAQNYLDIVRVAGLDINGEVDYIQFRNFCDKEGLNPILIETGGYPLTEVNWNVIFDKKVSLNTPCLVFGNEASGFPDAFLKSTLPKISVPQLGVLRSFNVSAAAAIVLWDFVSKYFKGSL